MKYTREQFRKALETREMQAFLQVVRTGEGTTGDDGYYTIFGGELAENLVDHPRRAVTRKLGGKPITSTAAGAYQFLTKTWDWIRGLYGFENFSQRCQDEAAVALIAHRGALADVLAGRIEAAIGKCNREWASLPGSPYGQPVLKLSRALEIYEQHAQLAPVVERSPVQSAVVTEEGKMNPFVIAAASKAVEMVPDLVRMFGGKKAEQNAVLAEKVVEIAQSVTGEANAQSAVERLETSPELQAEFREEVFKQRRELDEVADKRVEAAREFVNEYRGGKPVLGKFTFPELLSAFFVVGGFGLGIYVISGTDLSGELKAAVVGALVVQAISDIRGFWFGSSSRNEEKAK